MLVFEIETVMIEFQRHISGICNAGLTVALLTILQLNVVGAIIAITFVLSVLCISIYRYTCSIIQYIFFSTAIAEIFVYYVCVAYRIVWPHFHK